MYQQPEQEMRVVRDVVAELKALKEENAYLKKNYRKASKERCEARNELRSVKEENEKLKRILAIRHTIMDGLRKQVDNETAKEEIEKVEKENEKLWEEKGKQRNLLNQVCQRERGTFQAMAKYKCEVASLKTQNTNLKEENAKLRRETIDAWDRGYQQGQQVAHEEVEDTQQAETEKTEIIKTLVNSIVASGVMDDGQFLLNGGIFGELNRAERDAFSNILSEMNDDDWNEDDHQTKLGYTNTDGGILELSCD